MYGYIYLTTNTVNGKIYVGQHKSTKFDAWYVGSGIRLLNAIKYYGKDKFNVEVLDTAESKEELNEKEIYWIRKLDSRNDAIGYNLSRGGEGHIVSGDTRERLSAVNKGRKRTEETRRKLSESNKGNKKLSQANKGKKRPQISEALKKHFASDEARKAQSERLRRYYANKAEKWGR